MKHFNPRSPHGERLCSDTRSHLQNTFQPTLPARGATPPAPGRPETSPYFNPRSPHGERRVHMAIRSQFIRISTHAPRTGSDTMLAFFQILVSDFNPRSPHGERPAGCCTTISVKKFQPTLPARGATSALPYRSGLRKISTHAPRTGSDKTVVTQSGNRLDFNPRSPHGERP